MLDRTFASEGDIFLLRLLQGPGMTIGFPSCPAAFVTWTAAEEELMSPLVEAMALARQFMDMGFLLRAAIHQALAELMFLRAADTCAERLFLAHRELLPICQ